MVRLLIFNSRLSLLLFFLAAAIFLKNNTSSTVYAATTPLQIGIQTGQPLDNNGNILINESIAGRMAASGATSVRINFRLGPYTSDTAQFYASYDTIVNALKGKNLQVIGLMSNESYPGSQLDWIANNFENTEGDGNNNYIVGFCLQFARIAKHYENKISYWEIWNEPNAYSTSPLPGVYEGNSFIYPSNFAALLTECHAQVHFYNDINVSIISGGLFGHNIGGNYNSGSAGADYLDSTFNMGINNTGKFAWAKSTYGSYPIDAVGQHLYVDEGITLNISAYNTYLEYIHGVLTKWEGASSTKKTWVTEFGWPTDRITDSLQSSNLESALNAFKGKNYVAGAIWFQLDDVPVSNLYYGLFRSNGSKKPSWTTFNTFANSSNPSPTPTSSIVGSTVNGVIINPILNYYNNFGGAAYNGTPYDNGGTMYAHIWDYGYAQDFNQGSIGPNIIFDTGYRVQASFLTTYFIGNNHAILKFPISDEYGFGLGTRQDFQSGYMTWDSMNGVRVYTSSPTPVPTSIPTPVPTKTPTPTQSVPTPTPGLVGRTSSGTLIQPILNSYNNLGGASVNGTPYDNGGGIYAHIWDYGYVQDFQGGSIGRNIIFDTGHRIQASFFTNYTSGNNHNILRFPTTDEYGYGSGTRQDFQAGYMTWDSIYGVRIYPL